MAKIFKNKNLILILIVFALANLAIYWQFYFRGLLPFPGDLLVSFFYPWNSGGFVGFDQWTTHKEVIAADVIRQMYPWKSFAFDLIRHGQIPLWNPHNFSGYPLIANLQSSIFFPGNFVYLFLPTLWAWISQVIFLPTVFTLFMYHFLHSLKLGRPASIFGGIVVANVGYIMVWHEQLIITQVALFLPLILWSVNQHLATSKIKYLVIFSLGICGGILGGHAQTFIYVLIIVVSYLIFRRVSIRTYLPFLILGIMLGAIQLLPSLEIYLHSAREGEATKALFAPFVLTWESLSTIFAPDFFGNPATGNYSGQHYGDFQVYFGIVALTFATLSVFVKFGRSEVKFFALLGIIGLLFALWPLAYLPHILNIPIIASGVPARVIFVFQFCAAVLAAFGLDHILGTKRLIRREIIVLISVLTIYIFLWGLVIIFRTPQLVIASKNLVLPTLTFFFTAVVIIITGHPRFQRFIVGFTLVTILLAIGEYSYLFNKYQPFAPSKFVFPPHPVFEFLQKSADSNRLFGFGTAYVDNNFATYYRVFAAEGWDSLFIKRYGQLLASAKDGQLPRTILRSDAVFPSEDNFYRNRLFDLLGVKYILDKNDNPQTNWEPELEKFPPDHYRLVWQKIKWKAYERKTALPRAFLADSYFVADTDQEVLKKIYDPNFNLKSSVILEKDPHWLLAPGGQNEARIVSYNPNTVVINIQTEKPKALFLSDTYFPGWKATLDGEQTDIYRANYIFRSVRVPAGKHTVVFHYDPPVFKLGIILSIFSATVLFVIAFHRSRL